MSDQPVYPAKVIASLFDITERRVQQLVAQGVIPKTERGRYELFPAVQGYIKFLRERKLSEAVVSLDEARQRKLAAEAEMAEIELAKARADVVRIDDVARQWDAILSGVRTRLLALPTKVAPMVAVENDQSIVKEMIEDGVYSALGELAAGLSDSVGRPEPGIAELPEPVGSADKADDKRVGRPGAKAQSGG
jgi:phage terminase Nu1 subunit (DNA packaging protein)